MKPMNVDSRKFKKLLQGEILVKELASENPLERKWIEIKLSENSQASYPFRTPPNAMLGGSEFRPVCAPENASFKIRCAIFLKSDVDNGFDPNYDKVGLYIDISSVSDLNEFLERERLNLEEFVDSGSTDYPM